MMSTQTKLLLAQDLAPQASSAPSPKEGRLKVLLVRQDEPWMSAESREAAWGRWLFRHRGWMFIPLGGALFLQALGRYSLSDGPAGAGFSVLHLGAMGILALALLIRLHVAGRARPGTSSRGITFEAGQLITTGMYAHLRNPLYLANLLIWAGLGLLVGSGWWVGLLVGLAGLAYHLIVLAEEEFLLGRFGSQYIDYCRQVPRWIPKPIFRILPWRLAARIGQKNGLFSPLSAGSSSKAELSLAVESRPDLKCPSAAEMSSSLAGNSAEFSADKVETLSGKASLGQSRQAPLSQSEQAPSATVPQSFPSVHSVQEAECFTWRRALFREADTLMLVGLAGWFFAGLSVGRLPWQWTGGVLAALWQWSPGVAAVGWGWIKWHKKRSWPSKFPKPPVACRPLG